MCDLLFKCFIDFTILYTNFIVFCITVLASAINCATVALVDAGIEMYDLVIALSLVRM